MFSKKDKFIALPTVATRTKVDKETADCVNKINQAEDLGIAVEKYCPECIEKEQKEEITTTFYCRIRDIKGFFQLEPNLLQIEFYDDTLGLYDITEQEFLDKLDGLIDIR